MADLRNSTNRYLSLPLRTIFRNVGTAAGVDECLKVISTQAVHSFVSGLSYLGSTIAECEWPLFKLWYEQMYQVSYTCQISYHVRYHALIQKLKFGQFWPAQYMDGCTVLAKTAWELLVLLE